MQGLAHCLRQCRLYSWLNEQRAQEAMYVKEGNKKDENAPNSHSFNKRLKLGLDSISFIHHLLIFFSFSLDPNARH